ncbi:hypothetical protein BN1708_017680, partial [Verticillium longisporum]
DQLVSIKGLVIRTSPIIPDMKDAFFRCNVCNHSVNVGLDRGKISEPTKCPRPRCGSDNSMQIVHNRCTFEDKQIIKLQETPDSADTGSNLDHDLDSSYWDAAAMSPLTAQSAAALARLRAYRPPPLPTWDRLPASRRAAVLLLLFADRRGDLRVVITMRAASLRNYSGHAAFPGG